VTVAWTSHKDADSYGVLRATSNQGGYMQIAVGSTERYETRRQSRGVCTCVRRHCLQRDQMGGDVSAGCRGPGDVFTASTAQMSVEGLQFEYSAGDNAIPKEERT